MTETPRFGLVAEAYHRERPPLPAALFQAIEAELASGAPAGTRSLAVDLGAGTGLSTLPWCEHFERVLAVEPDPAMARALEGRHPRLEVRGVRAEALRLEPGSVDLVTAGNAFHWLDGPAVLALLLPALKPTGLLAFFAYGLVRFTPGQALFDRAFERYWAAHFHPRLVDTDYTPRTLEEFPGVSLLARHAIPNPHRWEVPRFLAFLRSTSYVGAWLRTAPGAESDLSAFEAELLEASGGEPLQVDLEVELILARAT